MPNANRHISTALIRELQTILREDYGSEMSLAEATEAARAYIQYFDVLADMPQTKGDNDAAE